jgi:hypothetical protein
MPPCHQENIESMKAMYASTDSRVRVCAASVWLLLVGQLLGSLPVLLGLSVQVVDSLVEEDLGNLGGALLGRDAAVGDRLVGLNEGVGKSLGGLVYPLLALLVGHKVSCLPFCC